MLNINKTKNFSVLEDIIEQANEEQQSKPQRVEYIFAKYMLRDVHLEYKKNSYSSAMKGQRENTQI